MNVIEIFEDAAARFPGRTALIWGAAGSEQTVSFAALADRSRRLASLFRDHGLHAGDAVVVFLPMGAALYEVMAAVLRLGMVPVFVDPYAWRDTLDRAVASLRVRAFVGTPKACLLRWFVPSLRHIPHAFSAGARVPGSTPLDAAERMEPLTAVEQCGADQTALLTFTSGSTGRPKGVLRTHEMLVATHPVLTRHLALQPGEVQLSVLPFFVFAHLGAGVTSVIPDLDPRSPALADPAPIVEQMRRWQVSGLVASPYLMRRLAEHAIVQGQSLPALRRVFTGGAPVFPSLLDAVAAAAPGAEVYALYGATEAEPIALVQRRDYGQRERDATAAGRGILAGEPVAELSLRVIEERWGEPRGPLSQADFDAEQVGAGRQGEIVVAGTHVSPGYLDGEGDRANKLVVDGTVWHRTGDAGYTDESGRLWLVGRCASRLARGGERLYPFCVEAALDGTPDLARGTIVEHGGSRMLVLQPAAALFEPNAALARVAWSQPDQVVRLREIPLDRRHHAKIDYPALHALLDRKEWDAMLPRPITPVAER